MSRATNAPASRERRRRILEEVKGFRGPRSKNIRQAMEADFSFDRSSEEYAMLYLWML